MTEKADVITVKGSIVAKTYALINACRLSAHSNFLPRGVQRAPAEYPGCTVFESYESLLDKKDTNVSTPISLTARTRKDR